MGKVYNVQTRQWTGDDDNLPEDYQRMLDFIERSGFVYTSARLLIDGEIQVRYGDEPDCENWEVVTEIDEYGRCAFGINWFISTAEVKHYHAALALR